MSREINLKTVLQELSLIRKELETEYTVLRIGIFGSFAQGNQRADSDIDILVELAKPTFDHYMDLKFHLEDRLCRPVDLVMDDMLKPCLRRTIEDEVIYA